jgi:hypothetical protein
MLLLADGLLEERKRAANGPLAPLYDSLASELEPLLGRELYIPQDKALLSKKGGRCEKDGTTLEFDPWSPKSHKCPTCGASYTGVFHHRAWITWYHLWLAERAVHGALFHALKGDARHASVARDILTAYADKYLAYPNVDNVLGPTRPFFSTYLESIWLLQICVAANFLEQAGDRATAELVRDRIVTPSRELIAQFDEHRSNRQVWNNAALLASALLCRDKKAADAVVNAKSGVAAHLTQALLKDGTWFEGDNYHQFAIRGLWYAVTMCEANGLKLPTAATKSFDRGIGGTFVSALPDFTFPSRKDSQYAVSLRQWRFAELAELGYARTKDEQIGSALARCYEDNHEKRDTGRSRSTADAERNVPSSLLTRADLGWRAMLHAMPDLPDLHAVEPKSLNLSGQGLAIFRRQGGVFAAMDYGQSGSGHGHPDRLNLLLSHGNTRWLDDLGTGSYVDRSLFWYRSTLAHNAPFWNGRNQGSGDGRLLAYEELGDIGWVEAEFVDGLVTFRRTLVVTPHYMIDEFSAHAESDASRVDLPWHLAGDVKGLAFVPRKLQPNEMIDGSEFVTDVASASMPKEPVHLRGSAAGTTLNVFFSAKGAELIRMSGPGQPASRLAPFYIVRFGAGRPMLRTVMAWDASIDQPQFRDGEICVTRGGEVHTHSRNSRGWRAEFATKAETRIVELAGRAAAPVPRPSKRVESPIIVRRSEPMAGWWSDLRADVRGRCSTFELGEKNYRRTEETWREAGSPTATVAVLDQDPFLVHIDVRAEHQRFSKPSDVNPFDNEHPDTMGAGVQLYYRSDESGSLRHGWMLIPEPGRETVRLREILPVATEQPSARWRPTPSGYELRIEFPFPGQDLFLDVVINDAVEGRVRRRGQLVTADVPGEFAYVRGDREDGSRAIHLRRS